MNFTFNIYVYSLNYLILICSFSTVFSLVVAGAVTIGLYFVHNSLENLILSCVFEALTSLGISTVYCVMVDLFPTNLRYIWLLMEHFDWITNNIAFSML